MLTLLRKLPIELSLVLRLSAVLLFAQLPIQIMNFEKIQGKVGRSNIPLSTTLVTQILGFFLALIFIYLLFALYSYWVAKYTDKLRQKISCSTKNWTMLCWLASTLLLFALNQYYFPLSIFAFSFNSSTNLLFLSIFYTLIAIQCGFFLVAAISFICDFYPKFTISCIALAITFTIASMMLPKQIQTHPHDHPNIIIIGIDSLRPDHVSALNPAAAPTPNIDRIIKKSMVFDNAYTPQARTFPAWMSILTGNYPKTTRTRFNLVKYDPKDYVAALPNQLKKYGYKSLYAIDETRFSNIDKRLGFDKTVHPAIGLNDFVIGTISDNILGNLVINTPLGAWLFPFNHMNRGAYVTYYPQTFVRSISRKLRSLPASPIFLAIHFELSHWPFSYAGHRTVFDPFDLNSDNLYPHYKAMIPLVDDQVGQLMAELNEQNLLENSIIILLSDHGEGFELQGDRITSLPGYVPGEHNVKPQMRFTALHQSRSHGTDILSPSQYHVLLSWQLPNSAPQHIQTPVSLVDIAPTILDILQNPTAQMDGKSLQPIFNNTMTTIDRPIFIETGISPQLVALSSPEAVSGTLADLMTLYKITDDAKVEIDPEKLATLIKNKQRAVINGDWLLAYYPNSEKPATWILVNLKTKRWTLDLQSTFATQANISQLKQQFMDFYQDEITNQQHDIA